VLIAGVVLGLAIIGSGTLFIATGLEGRANLEAALLQEEVLTSNDAPIAGVIVKHGAIVNAQQGATEAHTFGRFGPYSGMERKDPNDETYLRGLTIRYSLSLAVMGFGIADLGIGTGAVMVLLEFALTGSAVIVLCLLRRPQSAPIMRLVLQVAP